MSRPSMFDPEFRARACELARLSSKPLSQIAADLGVGHYVVQVDGQIKHPETARLLMAMMNR